MLAAAIVVVVAVVVAVVVVILVAGAASSERSLALGELAGGSAQPSRVLVVEARD